MNYLSSGAQLKAAGRQRRDDQRVEAYSTYLTLSRRALYRDDGDHENSKDRQTAFNKLRLLESDVLLLAKIAAVEDSFPAYGTADYEELEAVNHDPTATWKPFEDAEEGVLAAVRSSMKR